MDNVRHCENERPIIKPTLKETLQRLYRTLRSTRIMEVELPTIIRAFSTRSTLPQIVFGHMTLMVEAIRDANDVPIFDSSSQVSVCALLNHYSL